MVIESNMSPTMEVKEQEDVSEENKVIKKCLIFEKIIKESDSQERVKRNDEATPAKKRNPRSEVNKVLRQGRDLQPHRHNMRTCWRMPATWAGTRTRMPRRT